MDGGDAPKEVKTLAEFHVVLNEAEYKMIMEERAKRKAQLGEAKSVDPDEQDKELSNNKRKS
jgi:hypothetical protein